MGSADVVPGVSGGTMAFILGIYEELIESIHTFGSREFWQALARGKVRDAIHMVNWSFLSCVALGILLAIVLLARTLEHLLETQPLLVWSFFFGLVLASVFVVSQRIKEWKPKYWGALLVGAICAYGLVGLVPVQTPNAWWFLVLCGAVASCAMILPGISGAFLLLLLGKYAYVLSAVNDRDFLVIGLVGIGAIIGLILFSDLLSWLFHHYHNQTVVFLMGLMLGSLRRIWPWKESSITSGNILPPDMGELGIGISMIVCGIVAVLAIEWIASVLSHKSDTLGATE